MYNHAHRQWVCVCVPVCVWWHIRSDFYSTRWITAVHWRVFEADGFRCCNNQRDGARSVSCDSLWVLTFCNAADKSATLTRVSLSLISCEESLRNVRETNKHRFYRSIQFKNTTFTGTGFHTGAAAPQSRTKASPEHTLPIKLYYYYYYHHQIIIFSSSDTLLSSWRHYCTMFSTASLC